MTNNTNAAATPQALLEHASWARALARRLVGEAAADDLVQETWLAALQAEPDEERALRPWLGTVLGNFARQGWRTAGRRARREELAAAHEVQPSAAELTERAESQKLLMEHLLELPEDLREVLLLKYFEELSAAEIGRRKGLPASTIKSRLQRGIEQLRVALETRCAGGEEHWGLALLPLLRVPRPRAALVAWGTGMLGGTALGKLALWLFFGTLGVLILALAVLGGLPFMDSVPREPVSFQPLARASAPAPAPIEEPSARLSIESGEPKEVPAQGVTVASAQVMRLRVRFLDESGQAVAGVQFGARGASGGSGPSSTGTGRLEVDYEPWPGMDEGDLRYFHPSLASDRLSFPVHSQTLLDLGDVTVHPGGALRGRVLDGFGEPLVSATVSVRGAQVARSEGGMTSYRSTNLGSGTTQTDSAGVFRLSGLLAGDVRVDVKALQGLHEARSGWVEIRAGQETCGLEILAPAAPVERRIEGHVFDPDGHPLGGVDIDVSYDSFFSSGSMSFSTQADGFFRVVNTPDTEHRFALRVPSRLGWAPQFLTLVPGQVDVEVQFERGDEFCLTVLDEDGAALKAGRCSVLDEREQDLLQVFELSTADEGRADLRLPPGAFTIRVNAPGFALKTVHMGRGQLEAGDDLSLSLSARPGVRGRVTVEGRGVQGARLYLQRRATESTTYNGFPVRFEGRAEASASSGTDGRFTLDLREAGQYVVRAVLDGFAPCEWGPMQLSPAGGVADLELALRAGGTLRGQLLLDPGLNPAGRFVALSRADCWAETRRVGPDGVFEFEHLIPGPWWVSEVREALNDSEHSSSTSFFGAAHDAVPSNCVVREAGVTRHDLLRSTLPLCTLKGRLELVGQDMSSWRVQESGVSSVLAEFVLASSIALDADGNFEMNLVAEGTHAIHFGETNTEGLRFALRLDLHEGMNEWSARIETSGLQLQTAPPARSCYLWQGPDHLQAMQTLPPKLGADHTMHLLPAGPARLVSYEEGFDPSNPSEWPTWAELDLPPGVQVELKR